MGIGFFGRETGVAEFTDALSVGQSTMPRWAIVSSSVPTASGSLRLTYLAAQLSQTITRLRTISGTTAAGATPTLAKMGLYLEEQNGNLTLLGATPNTTGLWASATTEYETAMTASVTVSAGIRYALATLIVTAAAVPNYYGTANMPAVEASKSPRKSASFAGQTDLPASIASASLAVSGSATYGVLVP